MGSAYLSASNGTSNESAQITLATYSNFTAGAVVYFLENIGQIVLNDSDTVGTGYTTTATDGAALVVVNQNFSSIFNTTNEAGQIFLKGNSFGGVTVDTPPNDFTISASNLAGSAIAAYSDTGQLVIDASGQNIFFTIGNDSIFTFVNDDASINSTANNVGQMLIDGVHGGVNFTVGDNLVFTLDNQNGSTISNSSAGNDSGQIIFDGNKGTTSLTIGNNAVITLQNNTASSINGLGFDAGQMVFDGDGGVSTFSAGTNTTIRLSNFAACTIESGPDGNDAGQLVVDGNGGTASFSLGDNSVFTAYNDGLIVQESDNGSTGLLVGQVVFDGSAATGPVTLTTGENVILTAVLGPNGNLMGKAANLPAQFYFSDASVIGDPIISAVNQSGLPLSKLAGVLFTGTSNAPNANIQLTASSLMVSTTGPLTIGSLAAIPPAKPSCKTI